MRTYSPRTFTPPKTVDDLSKLSKVLNDRIASSDSKLELLHRSSAKLEVLNDRIHDIIALKPRVVKIDQFLESEELILLQSSLARLKLLQEGEEAIRILVEEHQRKQRMNWVKRGWNRLMQALMFTR